MSRTVLTRTVEAPLERVFAVVGHADMMAPVLAGYVKLEQLSTEPSGLGARHRITLLIDGSQIAPEVEVVEYVPKTHVAYRADARHVHADAAFDLRPNGPRATALTLTVDPAPPKRAILERDFEAIAVFCEEHGGGG